MKDRKQVTGSVVGAVIGGVVGVRYRIGDEEGAVRMDHDPGDRIPLRQGQLALETRTDRG